MAIAFKIEGVVSRKPHTSDRFACLPLAVPGGRGKTLLDVKVFDRDLISVVAGLQAGDHVPVDVELFTEPLRVDGKEIVSSRNGKTFKVWGIALKAVAIGDIKAAPPPAASDNGGDIPFA